MPVPANIDALSTTAASNSPSGSETPTEGDNYIRTLSAFIALLRDKLNGTSATGTVKDATFSGTMAGAASWAALQTFAAGLNPGNADQASSTAFDWYEEGTFTPELRLGGATTGITYDSRSARYTRVGNLLFFDIYISLSSKGSATGNATIVTLPYSGNAAPSTVCSAYVSGSVGSTYSRVGATTVGSTTVTLFKRGTGAESNITDADLTNSSVILVSGMYRTQ